MERIILMKAVIMSDTETRIWWMMLDRWFVIVSGKEIVMPWWTAFLCLGKINKGSKFVACGREASFEGFRFRFSFLLTSSSVSCWYAFRTSLQKLEIKNFYFAHIKSESIAFLPCSWLWTTFVAFLFMSKWEWISTVTIVGLKGVFIPSSQTVVHIRYQSKSAVSIPRCCLFCTYCRKPVGRAWYEFCYPLHLAGTTSI